MKKVSAIIFPKGGGQGWKNLEFVGSRILDNLPSVRQMKLGVHGGMQRIGTCAKGRKDNGQPCKFRNLIRKISTILDNFYFF